MQAAAQRVLLGAWAHRGPLAWLLWPLSLAYRLLWWLRQSLYRSGRLARVHPGVPVIVVGNVVAGGSGKTPVVIAVVTRLQSLGLRPGVVSRGYGRAGRECRAVHADSPARDVGDEALLIRRKTGAPVFVAVDRVEAAQALLSADPGVDVLVSDDGLQHLALRRDIEICVFDDSGVGNGFLLPAGPLREPWPRPTDLVLVAGDSSAHATPVFRVTRTLADHALRADGTRVPLETLRQLTAGGRPLHALAGIARPHRFFAMLRDLGLQLDSTQSLPDHAEFTGELARGHDGAAVLCTEKDAVKLWRHRPDALAMPLTLQIDPAFWLALQALLWQRGPDSVRAKLSSTDGHTPA